MRTEKIKIFLLQKEYLETIEGQNVLVDKVNEEDKECLSFSEGNYGSADIAMECLYGGRIENKLLKALFFGDEPFEYSFTPWECELNEKKPSDEQIVEHIKKNYETDDEEMITCIKQSTVFHDMVELRWISSETAKKIIAKLSTEVVWKELEQLEKKLENEGMAVDEWKNEENRKFIEQLFSYLNEAIKLGTGVLYAHILF